MPASCQIPGLQSTSKRDSKYTETVPPALLPRLNRFSKGFYLVHQTRHLHCIATRNSAIRKLGLIELHSSVNLIKLPLTCSLCFLAALQSPAGRAVSRDISVNVGAGMRIYST